MTRHIFVFGSNLAGKHYGGSAREANLKHGAVWGQGTGLRGNSYALPTLDENLRPLPLERIKKYVDVFLGNARGNLSWQFDIVAIGCGVAGFTPEEIAPMFKNAPHNCNLPKEFIECLIKK